MPNGEDLRRRLRESRLSREAEENRLRTLERELLVAEGLVSEMRRSGAGANDLRLRDALGEQARLAAEAQSARRTLQSNAALLLQLTAELEGDPRSAARSLRAGVPVVLLPVRIETRFVPPGEAGATRHELRIRIFPDEIAIDTHEEGLTDAEAADGDAFWQAVAAAGGTDDARREAARRLVTVYQRDPGRAAWILERTDPDNAGPAPRRPAAWTRAALSRVMPDRFVALGFVGGSLAGQAVGEPIPDPLTVGPTPESGTELHEHSPLPREAAWLVDYTAAEAAGMALRLPFTGEEAFRRGFDVLVVLGLKAGAGPGEGARLLTQLIDAHRFTEGFALVRQGTPTNNSDQSRSGWTSTEADEAALVDALVGPPRYAISPDLRTAADGQRLAAALGLDPGALDRVVRADSREEVNAGAMATALWPVTWGYYLEQMIGDAVGRDTKDAARRHNVQWIRGRGPLSAVRAGDVPYGVLPVGSLGRWVPDEKEPFEAKLLDLVQRLLPLWTKAAGRVPGVANQRAEGRQTRRRPWSRGRRRWGEPGEMLLRILGCQPSSTSFGVRHLLGEEYVWNLLALHGVDLLPEMWQRHYLENLATLERLGYPNVTVPIAGTFYDDVRHDWPGPLVQPEPVPEEGRLDPNYITWLRAPLDAGYLDRIRGEDFGGGTVPDSLLYVLLRHAALRTYVETGLKAKASRQLITWDEIRDRELVGIRVGEGERSPWDHLEDAVPDLTGGISLKFTLGAADLPSAAELDELREFRAALDHLEGVPPAELERLMTETLDTASHRLDAWVTSLATRRLASLREQTPVGAHLGAYGWVENLRPSSPRRAAPGGTVIDPPGPVLEAPDSAGFVHAPSLGQAVTAAVLRNAHATYASSSDPDRFAVDLSSRRVRHALWLADGVRQGQSLDALLGYRFERGLHEHHPGLELDRYVHALRAVYPLVAVPDREPPNPDASSGARRVVHGRHLLEAWEEGRVPFGDEVVVDPDRNLRVRLPSGSGDARQRAEHVAIVAELEVLKDDLDALADVAIADAVHQAVRGNHHRAGAALDTLAGRSRPWEPEVVRTPRGGVAVTYRVITLLPAGGAMVTGWRGDGPRAVADPALDGWAGSIIGPARRIRYRLRMTEPGAAPVEDTRDLEGLGIGALDFVSMLGVEQPEGATELEQRMAHAGLAGRPPGTTVSIVFERDPAWGTETLSVPEAAELVRRLRNVMAEARPLAPVDLMVPGEPEPPPGLLDLPDLAGRAEATVLEGQQVLRDLDTALAPFPEEGPVPDPAPPLGPVSAALWRAAALGIPASIPLTPTAAGSDERATLLSQARSVRAEMAKRVEAGGHAMDAFRTGGLDEGAARDRLVEAIQAILISAFPVLVRFRAPRPDELRTALAHPTLLGGDTDAPGRWFQRASRVAAPLMRYETAMLLSEALGGAPMALRVAQLPYRAEDRWAALPADETHPLEPGRVSLIVDDPLGADIDATLTGLFVAHLEDRVPSAKETTGVAFHFDQPNAQAPQAVLVAVPPDLTGAWEWDDLVATVTETLDLAKARAVDLEALGSLGHFLPAALLAINAEGATVSTDLQRYLETAPR